MRELHNNKSCSNDIDTEVYTNGNDNVYGREREKREQTKSEYETFNSQ